MFLHKQRTLSAVTFLFLPLVLSLLCILYQVIFACCSHIRHIFSAPTSWKGWAVMTGLRYSPLHAIELCGEMQGKFIVGRTLVPEAFIYSLQRNFATQTAFIIFVIGMKRWERWKPLVETVENLTFVLAQRLTAVKDFIFFWPITKEDRIYNLLTDPIISLVEQLKISSNQKRRSKADGMKMRSQRSRPEAFSALTASYR